MIAERRGNVNKLAVIFPGIGYSADKPLLHYSRRLAEKHGYEAIILPYSGFPKKVKGDRKKMEECFHIAVRQSRKMLSDVNYPEYDDILFIGKSIGTVAAAQIASETGKAIRLVLFTPLEETFSFGVGQAIVFTGSGDPWVGGENSRIPQLCERQGIPCRVIPAANHSLETGDPIQDIQNLKTVMEETERFVISGKDW